MKTFPTKLNQPAAPVDGSLTCDQGRSVRKTRKSDNGRNFAQME